MRSTQIKTRPDSAAQVAANIDDESRVWSALNDYSRRRILDLLRRAPMTTGDICSHFKFSRFAVMKHLKVLAQAGLVIVEKNGRERINHLNPIPIQKIHRRWIKPFETLPADRLLKLQRLAENLQD